LKKLQTKSLTFFTSFIIASASAFVYWLSHFLSNDKYSFILLAIIFFTIFCCGFVVINYVLRKFFIDNIRLIYKNIVQLTSPRFISIEKPVSDEEIIPEINRIFIDWGKNKEDEIDHLKQLEIYRKEFLGNVSHELKTPIFNVQGYIHTLIDGGIEDQDVNMLYLQKADKSLDRLISIVDDLESISKLEAGKMIIEQRTFDICDLSKDVIDSLELQAKEKGIQLTVKENSDKPFYVYADKERIRQVLVNLLVNSIKYGKSKGLTEMNFIDSNDIILVELADNGIGISKEHLPRLFERFYRVDKSRSRDEGGTGLGLSIVKHIIEAHNQKINVKSEIGLGTSFSFTLAKSK
jgi:two-component system phosphate regulon sensor histidine kinase PhoR